MGAFGQSIPAKAYEQVGYENHSRRSFVRKLLLALRTVGMVFHSGLSDMVPGNESNTAYSWLDSANDSSDPGTSYHYAFVFTYPTSETFDVVRDYTGVSYTRKYKPCIVVCVSAYAGTGSTAGNVDYSACNVYLEPGAIPVSDDGPFHNATQFGFADILTDNRFRNVAGQSYNATSLYSLVGPSNSTAFSPGKGGLRVYLDNWIPYGTSSLGSRVNLLTTRYWYLYLGPGGLYIQCGTGDTPQDAARRDVLNGAFIFLGGRIPYRAPAPANDPNYRTMCPVLPVYMTDATLTSNGNTANWFKSRSVYTRSADYLADPTAPRTYDSLANDESYGWHLFTLRRNDNWQRSFASYLYPDQASPAADSSGLGRNFMDRLIVGASNGIETGKFLNYPWWDGSNDTTTTRRDWRTMWDVPSVRVSDATMAEGEFTDPDTGKMWLSRRMPITPCTLCFDCTGLVKTSTLVSPVLGAPTTLTYDLTNVASFVSTPPSTGYGSNPPTLTGGVTDALLPSTMWFNSYYNSGSVGAWAKVVGQDYFESTIPNGSVAAPVLYVTIDIPPGYDSRYEFGLLFKAFARGSGTAGNILLLQTHAPNNSTTYAVLANLQNAGATTGHASYNYVDRAESRLIVGPDLDWSSGKLNFYITNQKTSGSSGDAYCRVGNFRLVARLRN
jgi:hypothetical protein